MKFSGKLFCIFSLFVASFTVSAEVFSLWPFGKKGMGAESPASALGGTKLWDEPVSINGYPTHLSISILETDLYQCISQLKSLYPDAIFSANNSALLMTVELKDGGKIRIYLIQAGGEYPVIQFSMRLPDKLPDHFTWPSQLPLPSGATPIVHMNFPDKKLHFGSFSGNSSPEQSVAEMKQQLLSNGWKSVSKEDPSQTAHASQAGGILLKDKPLSIAIMNAADSGNGITRGSVLVKPLK